MQDSGCGFPRSLRTAAWFLVAGVALSTGAPTSHSQDQEIDVAARLQGFDAYMNEIVAEWNVPGIGVGIVVGDELVFAQGYGYRDYGKKLPVTPRTLFQIASNSKLFTAVAAGLVVQDGKLTWDEPVREAVPAIRFHDDDLDRSVTLRDMLSHRTGITRHDLIWYKAKDTRPELFAKVRYMEPKEPLRTIFLYNNMMYMAAGYLIELQTGRTWEDVVRERIFGPLEMRSSLFTVAEMVKTRDFAVGYTERRDTFELYQIPYYEDTEGMAPCGAIISNIEDLSRWLICLMNDGKYGGKQALPVEVLKAVREPAIALPNTLGETRGYWELVNQAYGMGCWTASYRGHLLVYHGGDLDGFHSQVSFMPQDGIGVIVFVIGDHAASLYNTVSYNVYERLLGLGETPWSDRWLEVRLKGKKAGTEARSQAGAGRVGGTNPSHPLDDYVGEYENPAYGLLTIGLKDGQLQFDFHRIQFPMTHFHYDRFDTPDDERYGKWSVNFVTDPQGQVGKATMSLDEAEVSFTRRAPRLDPGLVQKLAGPYETPTGFTFQVELRKDGELAIVFPGQPDLKLVPYRGLAFRVTEFSDLVFEFVVDDGRVTALTQTDPSGVHTFARK